MTDQQDVPQPSTQPRTQPSTQAGTEPGGDDDGAALERAAEAIRQAHDAEGSVAAHDDITTLDAQRAGAYSEDPDGEGGHP